MSNIESIAKKSAQDRGNCVLPEKYGDNKIVLMVRDPWTIYSYWEIRDDVENQVKNNIKEKGLTPQKSVLRIYEVTAENESKNSPTYEFELRGWASNWYVHVENPGLSWIAEIGIVASNGEFFVLSKSNCVMTPPNRMSDVTDQEWMCSEDLYYKMFAAAGGYDVGKSSMELKEMIEEHLKRWRSSGGVTSGMFGNLDSFSGRK